MPAAGAGSREPRDTPRAACDFCGAARLRGERRRFVWDTGLGDKLVLADLCGRCAADGARLLELYGGHGRNAIKFMETVSVSAVEPRPLQRVGGILIRGFLYVLVALAAFVVVTFVTSRV